MDIWIARWNGQDEISWVWKEYSLPSGYKNLIGKLDVAEDCYNNSDFDITFEIIGNGEVLFTKVLTPGFQIVDLSIDISGVSTLRISVKDNAAKSGGTAFILGDLRIEK